LRFVCIDTLFITACLVAHDQTECHSPKTQNKGLQLDIGIVPLYCI
jgi:hypothetical protein